MLDVLADGYGGFVMLDLRAKVNNPIWADCIELWFWQHTPDGRRSVSTNLVMEVREKNCPITAEPIRLSHIGAQELIDQLWQAGLRPSEGSGSAGSLAATERHLADMRALVFKTAPKA
jgi:hypothetical protein